MSGCQEFFPAVTLDPIVSGTLTPAVAAAPHAHAPNSRWERVRCLSRT